jgi:hypothetical protein
VNTPKQGKVAATDPKTSDNARMGYQTAIQLMTQEGQLVWSGATAFAPILIMLLAGAVLDKLPFIQDPKMMAIINFIASLIGMSASYVWWSATARSRRIHKYWIACARDFELELEGVKTLTNGKALAEGGKVIAGGTEHLLKFPERHSHTTAFNFLYILCFVVFVVLALTQFARIAKLFT